MHDKDSVVDEESIETTKSDNQQNKYVTKLYDDKRKALKIA